jgi:RimJ/RimL family protein N-acetyltransferase
VRPLARADLDTVESWPQPGTPYDGAPPPQRSALEKDLYMEVSRWPRRLELSLEDAGGTLIGRMHLRDISLERCEARLGIMLGAPWVGHGYGEAALRLFLPHFFGPLGFQRMLLDVEAANERAIRLYQRLGFQPIGSFWREGGATRNLSWLDEPAHRHLAACFRVEGDVYWTRCHELELTGEDWARCP